MKQEALTTQELAIDVGMRVTHARIKKGWTQLKLCKETGLTQPALSRLERGRALPSLHMLMRIADALGTGIVAPYFSSTTPKKPSISFDVFNSGTQTMVVRG